MIKLFKGGIVAQIIVVVIVAVVLWLPSFFAPPDMNSISGGSIAYEMLQRWLSGHPYTATFIAFFSVVGEGLLLNMILYNYKLLSQSSLLPMLLYIVMMSTSGEALTLTPIVVTNLIFILALPYLLSDANLSITRDDVFMGGTMIGLGMMVYAPMAWMWIPLLVLFTTYKLYNVHDIIMALLGFLAPLIPVGFILFCQGTLAETATALWQDLQGFRLTAEGSVWSWIGSGLMLAVILVAVIKGLEYESEQPMVVQKCAKTIAAPMLAGLIVLFYAPLLPLDTAIFAISAAFMGTICLLNFKRKVWVADILLLGIIVIAVIKI